MKIDVQPQPPESAWISGENLVWHYTKSCSDDPAGTRAYWEPNIPYAELWFMLHRQSDGSWIHNHMLINFPESCAWCGGATNITDDVATPSGEPTPYLIVPATSGDLITHYIHWTDSSKMTWDSIMVGPPLAAVFWRTKSYVEEVQTPVYSGPALVSEQWEYCENDGVGCGHEKWYFAPNWGLIKVQPFNVGNGEAAYTSKQDMIRLR